jgi:hypothetical protein
MLARFLAQNQGTTSTLSSFLGAAASNSLRDDVSVAVSLVDDDEVTAACECACGKWGRAEERE